MSRKSTSRTITHDRVARLYHLVKLLGARSKTREGLIGKLKIDTRGFYRDIKKLREFGVQMEMKEGRYGLKETVAEALGHLPFPDPGLSVQEVLLLAKGPTSVHKRLRGRIKDFLGGPFPK